MCECSPIFYPPLCKRICHWSVNNFQKGLSKQCPSQGFALLQQCKPIYVYIVYYIPAVPRKWFVPTDYDTIYTMYLSFCTQTADPNHFPHNISQSFIQHFWVTYKKKSYPFTLSTMYTGTFLCDSAQYSIQKTGKLR